MRRDRPAEKYWDGREAQSHPNSMDGGDRTAEWVRTQAQDALAALDGLSGPTVPLDRLGAVVAAYEALHDLTWHLPHVEGWCCYTTYRDNWPHNVPVDDDHPARVNVWSAHTDEATANAWLPFWQERYADRKDYVWHVGVVPAKVRDFMAADETPERHMVRMGSR